MDILSEGTAYLVSFKPYVFISLLLLAFSLAFRMPFSKAMKSSFTVGVGFVGIFLVFNNFIGYIAPAVKALLQRTGLSFDVLDVGWPPMAAIAWSYKLVPIIMLMSAATNIIMLALKLTQTVNIDIWNFWQFIFIGALVQESTGSLILCIAAAVASTVIALKFADWSSHAVESFSGMSGVSITNFAGVVYYPLGVLGNKILKRLPGIGKIRLNPESIKEKLGFFGEPLFIGFIVGLSLGIASGYELRKLLELAFQAAAAMYILPIMARILTSGIMPISENIKEFAENHFPAFKNCRIGLDVAVLVGNPSVIVTSVLLMPVALVLAFALPGVRFIPLGELANIMGAAVMIVVSSRGDVFRSLIIFTPVLAGKLYVASNMAELYTRLARNVNLDLSGYDGLITSFLDGGNLLRFWLVKVFDFNIWALACIPLVAGLFYLARKSYFSDK